MAPKFSLYYREYIIESDKKKCQFPLFSISLESCEVKEFEEEYNTQLTGFVARGPCALQC